MHAAEVVATGLEVPEGPVKLPDGRIAFVQQVLGRVSAFDPRTGEVTTVSTAPGAPNSCTWSSIDGCLYVCQNGGVVDDWRADTPATPGIERVGLDGAVELVASEVEGEQLRAPNDLVFGPDGRLYFTDPSEAYDPSNPQVDNRLHALGPDGGEVLIVLPPSYTNGISFTIDGRVLWGESYHRTVCALEGGQRRVLATLPDGHIPDGIDVAADGRIFVTTVTGAGVDVLSPEGALLDHIHLDADALTTNCCLDGNVLWVTDFGRDWRDVGSGKGRLWRVETDAEERPRFAGGIRGR